MAIRKILTHPHNVLRRKAQTVTKFHEQLHRLLDDMHDTVKAEDGVGLAAPQIGISKRIILLLDEQRGWLEIINPEISPCPGSKQYVQMEGCLSLPKIVAKVKRYKNIKVKGQDRFGEPFEFEVNDSIGNYQHETDHLDGILTIDRAEQIFTLE